MTTSKQTSTISVNLVTTTPRNLPPQVWDTRAGRKPSSRKTLPPTITPRYKLTTIISRKKPTTKKTLLLSTTTPKPTSTTRYYKLSSQRTLSPTTTPRRKATTPTKKTTTKKTLPSKTPRPKHKPSSPRTVSPTTTPRHKPTTTTPRKKPASKKTLAPSTTPRHKPTTKKILPPTTTPRPKYTTKYIFPPTPPLIIHPKPTEKWRNITSPPKPPIVNVPQVGSKPKPKPNLKPTTIAPPRTTPRKITPTTTHYRDRVEKLNWDDLPFAPGAGGKIKTKIIIENKYHYHHPGYYALPVANKKYPQYYQSVPSYHYTSSDTGASILDFYIGHKLGNLATPTFSHQSFYDGYRPRYDHYTVHHYYHNKENIPKTQFVQSRTIIACVGDSADVCPTNTKSLCTSDGRLMCVVPVTVTSNCTNIPNATCVKSSLSCVNNTAAECVGTKKNSTLVDIPCISTAQIYGKLKVINNTIIIKGEKTYSTKYPAVATPTPPSTMPSFQEYCVTIVALPSRKPATKGEEAFNDASKFFNTFMERIFGL